MRDVEGSGSLNASGSKFEDQFVNSPEAESFLTTSSSSSTPSSDNLGHSMELNVTAGVFMVLMIAIVTAIFLCCCKTYVVCQKRRLRQRALENQPNNRRGIHQNLPMTHIYSDSPPSYDDIISGKIPSTVSGEPVGTRSNVETAPKAAEDAIEVHWSYEGSGFNSSPPPLYSCVVVENENANTSSQRHNTRSRAMNVLRWFHPDNNNNFNAVSRRMRATIQIVSGLVSGRKQGNNQDSSNQRQLDSVQVDSTPSTDSNSSAVSSTDSANTNTSRNSLSTESVTTADASTNER
ncbi:uncharacterized protein LOC143460866 [Clavelina lepadiformis]|uniref:uncharacterized protein LOC143460866 n=1 Tax=Clavelina lepadiformis TaxID=159417 RepID=UPI004040FBA1